MADNFDVIVDLAMNEDANKRVVDSVSDVESELKKLEETAKRTGKTMTEIMAENLEHWRKYSDDVLSKGNEVKKSFQEQAAEAAKSARAQASVWSAEARILTTRARLLTLQSTELQRVSSQMANLSRLALVGGTAVAGGIFKLASDFIKNAPEATRLTIEWNAAQDRINDSMSKIGKSAAEAALPILQKVAELASRTADFIETHPEIMRGALNAGLITAGLGILGTLVSKGIKLYADVLYLQAVPLQARAAEIQLLAAEQMLVAAQLQAEASGADVLEGAGDILGGGAGAGKLGKVGTVAALLGELAALTAAFAAGAIVTDKIFDHMEQRDVTFQDYITTLKQAIAIDAKTLGDFFGKNADWSIRPGQQAGPENLGNDWFRSVSEALGLLEEEANDAADAVENLAGSVEASPAFEKVLAAYEKYRNDDLKLVQDHYAKRQDIVSDGLRSEADAARRLREGTAQVQAQTASQIAQATADYNRQRVQDEQNYLKERADILRNAGEDIQRIEADLREELRRNELEHESRNVGLVAARDAVGLIREQQRYERQQAEARRQANLEIRQLRADLARRLEELEAQYQAERAQRYAEYVERLKEIRAEAAARLAELQAEHQAELKKIREQTAAKLRAADEEFRAERARRYQYFIQQIRDLDASLLGERNLKIQRQQQMLADLNNFLTAYRAGLASLQNAVPGKSEGGYTSGLVMTGERGVEWIANNRSTKAAEDIIGGRLTQDIFLRAMQAYRQTVQQGTYIDQRRLDTSLSKEQLRDMETSSVRALQFVLGGK
jgi:hypothetical protein